MKNPIFLLTVTDIEYQAAKNVFSKDMDHKQDDLYWEEGIFCNRPCILYKAPEMGGRAKELKGSASNLFPRIVKRARPL